MAIPPDYINHQPQVEVADSTMVPRARKQAWSREIALTTLVTRFGVFPFQRLLYSTALPRLRFFQSSQHPATFGVRASIGIAPPESSGINDANLSKKATCVMTV